jgi:hypothetical protein
MSGLKTKAFATNLQKYMERIRLAARPTNNPEN